MSRFAKLLLAIGFAASTGHAGAQLYVQNSWARTGPDVAGAQGHAEFRSGLFFTIDYSIFLQLTNQIEGPLTFSLSESGYGTIDQYVGVSNDPSLPYGCYRGVADATGGDLSQGASTSLFCIEEPPPPPPGGTDIEGPPGGESGGGCGGPCPESPLLLDLTGDGIRTTGAENAVRFDLDADGTPELLGWTDPGSDDAFLWMDLNNDHRVTDGRELFGVATELPNGQVASDGFDALRAYDDVRHGGNGDGRISDADAVWKSLRLWVDENHNGRSEPQEVSPIQSFQVLELHLTYVVHPWPDEHGNVHFLRGTYLRRDSSPTSNGNTARRLELTDVFFKVINQ
ncbi:MAG: hypothetical protein ACSLFQ_02140 [Thermoanaerobaculia bacterium]